MKTYHRKIKAKQKKKNAQKVFRDIEKEINKAYTKDARKSSGGVKQNRRKSKEVVEYKLK